jgi:hypothetical protein
MALGKEAGRRWEGVAVARGMKKSSNMMGFIPMWARARRASSILDVRASFRTRSANQSVEELGAHAVRVLECGGGT